MIPTKRVDLLVDEMIENEIDYWVEDRREELPE